MWTYQSALTQASLSIVDLMTPEQVDAPMSGGDDAEALVSGLEDDIDLGKLWLTGRVARILSYAVRVRDEVPTVVATDDVRHLRVRVRCNAHLSEEERQRREEYLDRMSKCVEKLFHGPVVPNSRRRRQLDPVEQEVCRRLGRAMAAVHAVAESPVPPVSEEPQQEGDGDAEGEDEDEAGHAAAHAPPEPAQKNHEQMTRVLRAETRCRRLLEREAFPKRRGEGGATANGAATHGAAAAAAPQGVSQGDAASQGHPQQETGQQETGQQETRKRFRPTKKKKKKQNTRNVEAEQGEGQQVERRAEEREVRRRNPPRQAKYKAQPIIGKHAPDAEEAAAGACSRRGARPPPDTFPFPPRERRKE